MPARVAVLSDLEANIAFLEQALRRLGVVGADGKWAYGGGHLVVLSDSVDRGRDVFAVLWLLPGLPAQSGMAGAAAPTVPATQPHNHTSTTPPRAKTHHPHTPT